MLFPVSGRPRACCLLCPLCGGLTVSALSSVLGKVLFEPQTDQASTGAILIHTLTMVVYNFLIFCSRRPVVVDSLLEKVPTAT